MNNDQYTKLRLHIQIVGFTILSQLAKSDAQMYLWLGAAFICVICLKSE